ADRVAVHRAGDPLVTGKAAREEIGAVGVPVVRGLAEVEDDDPADAALRRTAALAAKRPQGGRVLVERDRGARPRMRLCVWLGMRRMRLRLRLDGRAHVPRRRLPTWERSRLEPVIARYSRPAMARIWSDEGKLRAWLDVELAATAAWAELGVVPPDAARALQEQAVPPSPERVAELEASLHHDTAAFVDAVADRLGEEGRCLH